MNLTASFPLDPIKARFAGWVLVALSLHALLLLIPITPGSPSVEGLQTLSISLLRPWQASTPTAGALPISESQTQPLTEPLTEPAAQRSSATPRKEPVRQVAPVHPPPVAGAEPTKPPLSAARLMDSAKRLQWRRSEPGQPRRLGETEPWDPPRNWRSGIPEAGSRFDGRALPQRAEIVDRWLAADGSHHVLVETPDGEMLCGRAAAWDPMQPLVEPVMMFRRCGSGASTFEWPEHYRREPSDSPAAGRR